MRESSIVEEWKAEVEAMGQAKGQAKGEAKGRVGAKREDLLRVLQVRFPTPVPADLEAVIQVQTDLDTLSRWFDAALRTASLDEFRALVQQ